MPVASRVVGVGGVDQPPHHRDSDSPVPRHHPSDGTGAFRLHPRQLVDCIVRGDSLDSGCFSACVAPQHDFIDGDETCVMACHAALVAPHGDLTGRGGVGGGEHYPVSVGGCTTVVWKGAGAGGSRGALMSLEPHPPTALFRPLSWGPGLSTRRHGRSR